MNPRDRILEYALWRLHAPQPETDLAVEVRRAWERGAVGPDLADMPADDLPEFDEPEAGGVRAARRAALALAAAAALVAALVGALLLRERPRTLAELSRPVARLEGSTWGVRAGSATLSAGEEALAQEGDPITVTYWPLKDGRLGGHFETATLSDGRVMRGAGGPRGVDGEGPAP